MNPTLKFMFITFSFESRRVHLSACKISILANIEQSPSKFQQKPSFSSQKPLAPLSWGVEWRVSRSYGPRVTSRLTQHVEPSITVEHEVFKYDWSNGKLYLPLLDKVIDLCIHHCEAVTLSLVTILHGNEDVTTRTEDSQELMKGGGVDLPWGETIGAYNGIVAFIIDRNGPKVIYCSMDIILVDVLLPGLAQHAKGSIQPINHGVPVAGDLPSQQTGSCGQIKD